MNAPDFPLLSDELTAVRARALCGAGRLAWYTGDLDGAVIHLENALSLARAAREEVTVARALNALGIVAVVRGEFERASQLFNQALEISQRIGHPPSLLDTLCNLGYIIADMEATPETLAMCADGVALARREGDRRALGILLGNHGMLLCFDGQLEPSLPLLEEGLEVTRGVGETWNEARTCWCLGHHALWEAPFAPDDRARRAHAELALTHFSVTLRIIRAVKGKWETPYILEAYALMAIANAECARGAQLFGASQALRERMQSVVAPAILPHYERFVTLAREGLCGAEDYETHRMMGWREGSAMAIGDALTLLPSVDE